ncbi:gamma-glutamylcyclotransferase [Candidatus Methylacidiphilum infernorum]|uniref:Gamma-glutamylcyclotransferase n=1 Tax=Candidatus Methylacidiphilum infernorum TaxID=511746 RepID=A0ABX7PTV9_9BACT|nr:gamma-glutamylcyclotransferase [Candidatus Methylacidiphilum infernorum]QSR86101.1 gamma-glutamylcyclotransferase [Candidatus Methylacidiphilum infernorum]
MNARRARATEGERQPPKENTAGLLRLFVYGTLKLRCWNHERFCLGVLSVEEAVVRGLLYELPSGIPLLEVLEADVLPMAPPTRSPT